MRKPTRRNLMTSIGIGAGAGIGGFLTGRSSAKTPTPEPKNWREKRYRFWLDRSEWVEALGDPPYSPENWQCCGRMLAPDSIGKVLILRRPTDDGWVYRPERDTDVSMGYRRLSEDKSNALTEKHGDARTVSLSEVLDALADNPQAAEDA